MNASQKQLLCELEIRDDSFRDDRMGNSLFLVNIFMVSTTIPVYQKALDNRGSQSLKKPQSYSEVSTNRHMLFKGKYSFQIILRSPVTVGKYKKP